MINGVFVLQEFSSLNGKVSDLLVSLVSSASDPKPLQF